MFKIDDRVVLIEDYKIFGKTFAYKGEKGTIAYIDKEDRDLIEVLMDEYNPIRDTRGISNHRGYILDAFSGSIRKIDPDPEYNIILSRDNYGTVSDIVKKHSGIADFEHRIVKQYIRELKWSIRKNLRTLGIPSDYLEDMAKYSKTINSILKAEGVEICIHERGWKTTPEGRRWGSEVRIKEAQENNDLFTEDMDFIGIWVNWSENMPLSLMRLIEEERAYERWRN